MVSFFTLDTLYTLGSDDFAEVYRVTFGISDNKFAIFIDVNRSNTYTSSTSVTLIAFIDFVSLIASRTCCTSFALFTLDALVTLIAFVANYFAEVNIVTVCVYDYKFTIFVDCGRSNTVTSFTLDTLNTLVTFIALVSLFALETLLTPCTSSAFCTSFAFIPLFALDVTKVKCGFVCKGNLQITVFNNNSLDADTIVTILASGTSITLFTLDTLNALVAFITFVALFALGSNYDTKVRYSIIRKSDNEFTSLIDFGFGYTYTVITCGTSVTFITFIALVAFIALDALLTLVTLVTFITFFASGTYRTRCTSFALITLVALGSNYFADIGSLVVRENENEFAVRVDFSTSYTNALLTLISFIASGTCRTGSTRCSCFSLVALGAYNDTEVRHGIIGKGNDKFALVIDFSLGDAYTIVTSRTSSTLDTLFTLVTLITLGTNNNTKVSSLTICICNNKFAICIDYGRRNADTVCTIHTNNFIKVDSLAIRGRQHELTLGINVCRSNTYTIFTISTVLAVGTVFAVCSVFTVFTIKTIGNTKVQYGIIGQSNKKFILIREGSRLNANTIFTCGGFKRGSPLGFSTSVAILLGNFVSRLAIQTV